tara:strand:- start:258 stop:881 length:624 start_codon:yes stop_codon:yes gene_type:complete
MPTFNDQGQHFKDPWLLLPYFSTATAIYLTDYGGTTRTSATTAFFTGMSQRGVEEQTDWASDTYKTLVSVTGKGLCGGMIGPTSAASGTTTFEITVDGLLTEIAVADIASGSRGFLVAGGMFEGNGFTSTPVATYSWSYGDNLSTDKTTFISLPGNDNYWQPWSTGAFLGTAYLRFNTSLLVRAKHSAAITNSTATAYSGVMYRKGL